MRWNDLFADLELELDAAQHRERDLEIAERTRLERSRIGLRDRLDAARGHRLGVSVDTLGLVRGMLLRVGADWLLLRCDRDQWIIDIGSVLGVSGLPTSARAPGSVGAVAGSLGWAAAWRVLARDRTPLLVRRRDGTSLSGVADRVGEDFVELACGTQGLPTGHTRTREAVPFAAVVAVRCQDQE